MYGRQWSSSTYRFGFNAQEKDDEICGVGNSIHFEFREYDSRLGRFKSIDPDNTKYSWQSPYVYHRNNPIRYIDYLGKGDPPASEQANKLLVQSKQEYNKSDELKKQAETKITESIQLLDKASALLNGNYTNNDLQNSLNLAEQASVLANEGSKLFEEAGNHAKAGDEYLNKAISLIPQMMNEQLAELDKLNKWGDETKFNIVVNNITNTFGINALMGVGTIELFGPTLSKKPYMGSYPGTSRWSKYVASKFPCEVGAKLPTGGTSVTRGIGRIAVPLMLIWQTFETAESIHHLYQTYSNGPTQEEIQYYLDDFEKWKKEN